MTDMLHTFHFNNNNIIHTDMFTIYSIILHFSIFMMCLGALAVVALAHHMGEGYPPRHICEHLMFVFAYKIIHYIHIYNYVFTFIINKNTYAVVRHAY